MSHYRDLKVWRLSMDLAVKVYTVTSDFPAKERFGLASQWRRLAVSVVSNVAEGRGRRNTREFRRFVDIAYGSLIELETQLTLSGRLSFLATGDRAELDRMCREVGRTLDGLRTSLIALAQD